MPEDEGAFFSDMREDMVASSDSAVPSMMTTDNEEATPTPQICMDSGGANVDGASLAADDTLPSTALTMEDDEPSSSSDSRCSSTPPEPHMPAPVFPGMSQSTISAVLNEDDALGFQLLDLDITPPTPLVVDTPHTAEEGDEHINGTHFSFDHQPHEPPPELPAINEDEERLSVSDSTSSHIDDDEEYEMPEEDNAHVVAEGNGDTTAVTQLRQEQQLGSNEEARERKRSLSSSNLATTVGGEAAGDTSQGGADNQPDQKVPAVSLTTVTSDPHSPATPYLEQLAKADDDSVTIRLTPGRKTKESVGRCQSQIVLGAPHAVDDRSRSFDAVSPSGGLEKTLSSSTPSIDASGEQTQQQQQQTAGAGATVDDALSDAAGGGSLTRFFIRLIFPIIVMMGAVQIEKPAVRRREIHARLSRHYPWRCRPDRASCLHSARITSLLPLLSRLILPGDPYP